VPKSSIASVSKYVEMPTPLKERFSLDLPRGAEIICIRDASPSNTARISLSLSKSVEPSPRKWPPFETRYFILTEEEFPPHSTTGFYLVHLGDFWAYGEYVDVNGGFHFHDGKFRFSLFEEKLL
jgi:hypothetical protein